MSRSRRAPSPLAAGGGRIALLQGDSLAVWEAAALGRGPRQVPLEGTGFGVGALADGSLLALAVNAARETRGLRLRPSGETPEPLAGVLPIGTPRSHVFAAARPDRFLLVSPSSRYSLYEVAIADGRMTLAASEPMEGADHDTAAGLPDGSVVFHRAGALVRIAPGAAPRRTPTAMRVQELSPGRGASVWAAGERGELASIALTGAEAAPTVQTGATVVLDLDGGGDGAVALLADDTRSARSAVPASQAAPAWGNFRVARLGPDGAPRWETPLPGPAAFVRLAMGVVAVTDGETITALADATGEILET